MTVGRPSRGATRVAKEHERQEPANFRFIRQPIDDDPSEPDGFLCEVRPGLIDTCDLIAAEAVCGVDRFENGVETLR